MTTPTYQHWQLVTDQEQIIWLTLDRKDSTVNTLTRLVFAELGQIISTIHEQKECRGVVIRSGKPAGIPGADIQQFVDLKNVDEAMTLVSDVHAVLQKLADLSIPTVFIASGFCLGGGCELALACRYRIADDDPKTMIGLPEVNLGLHPGWGGTVRAPELVGVINAMQLMLKGRPEDARNAKRFGLIDAVVPARHLETAARTMIQMQPPRQQPPAYIRHLDRPWLRPWVGKYLLYKLHQQRINPDHYPAPYAIIKNWMHAHDYGYRAYERECQSIAELALLPVTKHLINLFFLQDRLKAFAKESKSTIKHVHVIGAGTMGGDIASVCVLRGLTVSLQDSQDGAIAATYKRAAKLFKSRLKTKPAIRAAFDRLIPDKAGRLIGKADVIIEAIFENLAVKQELFKNLELQAKPNAILATNTSSLPLDDISLYMQNPTRLVGIHFFNPVPKMKLVEVVKSDKTDSVVNSQACAFVGKLGMLPLPVTSHPGFLVNRILMPYMLEAVQLVAEGVAPESVDAAALGFGMPMGPVELSDYVGLDICLAVAKVLLPDQTQVPAPLQEKIAQGHLGVKSGQGFYRYENGKAVKKHETSKHKTTSSDDYNGDIIDRMIYRMLIEAAACLREGVVADTALLDAGMVFGTGFAPFRGGLWTFAKSEGGDKVQRTFDRLAQKYGQRFQSQTNWRDLLDQ